MTKSEKAAGYFRNGFNCAQAVFAAFGPDSGITEDESLKIACAFGGGMGRQQLICGAVTGSLMALGLKYGKASHDDDGKKQQTYATAREFCSEFVRKFGSLNCRELLMGLDMNNPEENQKIRDLDLSETHCARYVEEAVKITEKLIET